MEYECPLRPLLVGMAGIDAKQVFELPPAEDEQAVEPLATDAGDPALGVSVRVRCPDRRADHGDPFALEDVIAAATELGVAIVDQQAERLLVSIERHQQVRRLLGDRGAGWVRRAGDQLDPAALQRDEEEHLDPFNHAVSTVKKSEATVVAACWRRKSRQESSSRCGRRVRKFGRTGRPGFCGGIDSRDPMRAVELRHRRGRCDIRARASSLGQWSWISHLSSERGARRRAQQTRSRCVSVLANDSAEQVVPVHGGRAGSAVDRRGLAAVRRGRAGGRGAGGVPDRPMVSRALPRSPSPHGWTSWPNSSVRQTPPVENRPKGWFTAHLKSGVGRDRLGDNVTGPEGE